MTAQTVCGHKLCDVLRRKRCCRPIKNAFRIRGCRARLRAVVDLRSKRSDKRQLDLLRPYDGMDQHQLPTRTDFQAQVCMILTVTLLGNFVQRSQKALLIRLHMQVLILPATLSVWHKR